MFTDNRCANRVITGAALGATVGGAVGAVYGVAALHTHSVAAPAAAHALANIASAVYWNATRAEKVIGEKKWEGEDQ